MGALAALLGTEAPPPVELGTCEWCRGAPATWRFTVAPAKKNRAGEVVARATVVAVCEQCRRKLEQRRDEHEQVVRRERAEARASKARRGR